MSDLIPQGTYRAKGVSIDTDDGPTYAQFGESKEKRTPQVVGNFEIIAGDEAGRRIAWIGYFTEGSNQRTIESLRHMGFRGPDLQAATTQALDNEVEIVVVHEEYDGKWRAKVAWVNRAGGGGLRLAEPMGKDALRRFSAQMKGVVQGVPEGNGPRPPASKPASPPPSRPAPSSRRGPEPPPPSDDDIPF